MSYSSNCKSIKPFRKPVLLIPIVILVSCLSFGLCEIYFRIQNYPHYERTYPGQYKNEQRYGGDWLEVDPELGWSLDWLPFSNKDLQGQFKRIMFLGDSFVFGVGVNSKQTIPYLLNYELGKEYKINHRSELKTIS